jgi:hypothetical protein
MEKLILKETETYKLEVNDKGEYIEFDLTDISLPERVLNACDNITKIDKEYAEEMRKINIDTINSDEETVRKCIAIEKDKCSKLRKEFDSFLGEGACQKIFGDTNKYGMFNTLFDALEPHFAKMKINLEKGKKKLVSKYLPKDNDVM